MSNSKRGVFRLSVLMTVLALLAASCSSGTDAPLGGTASPPPDFPATGAGPVSGATAFPGGPEDSPGESVDLGQRALTVYFPNWSVRSDPGKTVENLPWDQITAVNHAFWDIVPTQAMEEAYRDSGNAGLWKVNGDTPFTIRATDPEVDFGENGHFAQYEKMCGQYPGVSVMLAVGGWTRSGMFSEMASGAESRAVFIQSCIDTLKAYPWLAGIDLDWEYPGVDWQTNGRPPENDLDQGCPSRAGDAVNLTALLKEMREGFDKAFPGESRQITICAPASSWPVNSQWNTYYPGVSTNYEFDRIIGCLDRINVMSYDHSGSWTGVWHHTGPYATQSRSDWSVEQAINYYVGDWALPAGKLNMGAATYARGWLLDFDKVMGGQEAFDALKPGDELAFLMGDTQKGSIGEQEMLLYSNICRFEAGDGWIYWLDGAARAPVQANNNPDSPYYGWILSYDDLASVGEKVGLAGQRGIGGFIVWDSAGDAPGEQSLIAAISDGLARLGGE